MRVLMLSPFGLRDHGGMGRLVCYLTSYWQSRSGSPACRVIDSRGVGHRLLWPLSFTKAYAVVLGELLRRRVDVAHLHVASRGSTIRKILLGWLIRQFHVPVVLHLHGGDYDAFLSTLPPILKRRVYHLFRQATYVVVLGQLWKDFVCREMGLQAERVHILMNAVPGPSALPTSRHSRVRRILYLGRLEENKGLAELIEALGSPQVRPLSWEAVLAGSGEVDRYRAMARDGGLADRIVFPGWVSTNRVHQYLEEADILILPSHFEGLPMAILEAMAYGLAIIATPVGAIPEAVVHGHSALLVPVKDPSALAAAVELVLRDDGLRARLSEGARRRYLERFDIGQYAARLEALYRQCGSGDRQCGAEGRVGRVTS